MVRDLLHHMEVFDMNPAEVLMFDERFPGLLWQLETYVWQKQILQKGLEEAEKKT